MKPTKLRDVISQLIFPRLGSNLHPNVPADDHARDIEDLLAEYPVGGLVLFNGSLATTPETLARLQSVSDYPLLVAADIERGAGQQLRGATVFPHAMAFNSPGLNSPGLGAPGLDSPGLGAPGFGSPSFGEAGFGAADSGAPGAMHTSEVSVVDSIERTAQIVSREALSAGIQISFSPVADVHSNPNNPIISTRAFGTDPSAVARRVSAYIRGCHNVGLLTTAKHFPGHGDTETDSHTEVPVVDKSMIELEQIEFTPFREAISEGVDLIMTAHVAYPSIDPSGSIATSSFAVLTDLLRGRMGFEGVIITDSLLMAGAGDEVDDSRYANMIRAGVDILLDVADPPAVIRQIEGEVRTGRLDEALVYQAFERVWRLKEGLLYRFGPSIFSEPSRVVTVTADDRVCNQNFADEIASRACHIRSGSVSDVRLNRNGICVVHVCPRPIYSDPTVESVEKMFSEVFEDMSFFNAFPDLLETPDFSTEILERAQESSGVVVLVTAKPAAWQLFGITPGQATLIDSLLKLGGCVLAFTGSPVEEIDEDKATLTFCLYSDTAPSLKALVTRLAAIADRKK